jgi:hypothetical protein
MLTVPKIKDLVNNPNKKYESIYEIISKSNNHKMNDNSSNNSSDIFNLPIIIQQDKEEEMKNELKIFLKSQLSERMEDPNKKLDSDSISYYEFK